MSLDSKIAKEQIIVFNDVYTINELVGLSEDLVGKAIETNSSRIAYFGALAAQAEATYHMAKAVRESTDAAIKLDVIKTVKPKPTIPEIESRVLTDDMHIDAVKTEIEALHKFKTLKAIVAGLHERSLQITNLTADMRQERKLAEFDRTAASGYGQTLKSRKSRKAESEVE